jgi:peptide/nickel transport system permease protein
MGRYLIRRTATMMLALFGISVLMFVMIRVIPGDIVQSIFGQVAHSDQAVAALRSYFGLDQPLWLQYLRWLAQVVHGDFGVSWRNQMPISDLIGSRLPVTLELTFLAMLVSGGLGIPLGVFSAVRRDSWMDNVVRVLSMFSLSVPEFFQGVVLILAFSLILKWIPSVSYVSLTDAPLTNLTIMLLPVLSLGTVRASNIVRMTRSCMLEVLSSQYVTAARAKGLSESAVYYNHALRSALVPIISILGLQIGYLLSGAVIVEMVFSLPGIGRLLVLAVSQRDYPLVQAVTVTLAFLFLATNLLADVLYSVADPRIRRS